jgi:hypothetical protein
MKYLSTLVLACLIVGCGGGDDPLPVDDGGNGNGNGTDGSDAALQVLQQCAAAEIDGLLLVATDLAALAGGTLDGVTLQGVDNIGKQIPFMLDMTGDGLPEANGFLGFADAAGDPADVDLSGIETDNNLSKLPDVLATMPVGGVVTVRIEELGAGLVELQVTFGSLGPDTINGQVVRSSETCPTTFTFQDVSAAGLLLGAIPNGVTIGFAMTPSDGTDSVEGDAIFNGSDTVRLEVKLNGEDPVYVFNMSLSTGSVTKA